MYQRASSSSGPSAYYLAMNTKIRNLTLTPNQEQLLVKMPGKFLLFYVHMSEVQPAL